MTYNTRHFCGAIIVICIGCMQYDTDSSTYVAFRIARVIVSMAALVITSGKGEDKTKYKTNCYYCFNCFSVAELANKGLKKFLISYIKQCKEGEVLRFYRRSAENGEFFVQGLNEKEEIVMQALIGFEENAK